MSSTLQSNIVWQMYMKMSIQSVWYYETTQKQLGITISAPSLDVVTRWSSTFTMLRNAYRIRVFLNTIRSKVHYLRTFSISNDVWEKCWTICDFLQSAASLTECQSGSPYATLGITVKAFKMLLSKCRTIVDKNNVILSPLAQKMINKLTKYDEVLCTETAQLAKILYLTFSSDILSDTEILRRYVVLPSDVNKHNLITRSTEIEPQDASGANFIHNILNDDSVGEEFDNELISFLRATSIGDRRSDPFEWWQLNEKRYPNVAPILSDVLAIQASSVSSEECFSMAGNLLDEHRTKLSEESFR